MPTEAEVLEALRPVEDPEIHRSIVDLNMVKGIAVEGPNVRVTVALTVAGCPMRAEITQRVSDAVRPLPGVLPRPVLGRTDCRADDVRDQNGCQRVAVGRADRVIRRFQPLDAIRRRQDSLSDSPLSSCQPRLSI